MNGASLGRAAPWERECYPQANGPCQSWVYREFCISFPELRIPRFYDRDAKLYWACGLVRWACRSANGA